MKMKGRKVSTTLTRKRLIFGALVCLSLLSSCEVTRVITTTAESKQLDSVNVIIQTKTVESYVGSKSTKF